SGVLFGFLLLHIIGIFLFTRGFLLSRQVLENKSSCQDNLYHTYLNDDITFQKTVIFLIDALRFDFTVPGPQGENAKKAKSYHNSLKVLYEMALSKPENTLLLKFIADPPTTTLQRLQGMTTGSLPTFIDAGSNFAGTSILEDNWLYQFTESLDKRIAFMGDDTWSALFEQNFNISYPYESLNVWDLDTVDNGVIEHLFPLLESTDDSTWDIIIGHCLGVDHVGHRYGPEHESMATKLFQMDQVIRRLVDSIDDDTLLIIMGDHGMDAKGDHGGDSQLEVESTLWMYSKKPFFGKLSGDLYNIQNGGENYRSVNQIDLVPTISLLMNSPIPFNNLGSPIAEVFLGPQGSDWLKLAQSNFLVSAQVQRYRETYNGFFQHDSQADGLWLAVVDAMNGFSDLSDFTQAQKVVEATVTHQQYTLNQCRHLWARFDMPLIYMGISILILSVVGLILVNKISNHDLPSLSVVLLINSLKGVIIGNVIIRISTFFMLTRFTSPFDIDLSLLILFAAALGYILGLFYTVMRNSSAFHNLLLPIASPKHLYKRGINGGFWSLGGITLILVHALLFASNSFTIWEDKILWYLLASFGFAILVASFRIKNPRFRTLAIYHGVIFLLLNRVSSMSTLCREEQSTHCTATYSASVNSSSWVIFALALMSILLPSIIATFYATSASYNGSAIMWIGRGLRIVMFFSTVFWALDMVEMKNWDISWFMTSTTLGFAKLIIARLVLGSTLLAANFAWYCGPMCVQIQFSAMNSGDKSATGPVRAYILGYSNIYGSVFFLFVINFFASMLVISNPLGALVLCLLMYSILTILELMDIHSLQSSFVIPIILGLMGQAYFFATGHQATIPSVQWNIGFIATQTISFPLTHLTILFNTFSGPILTTLAVPLISLWKIPPISDRMLTGNSQLLLTSCFKNLINYLAYQTVVTISACAFAANFRRHLMVWKIFAPRFILAGINLILVDLLAVIALAFGVGFVVFNVNRIF
ncbi:hypothetical protein NADFUDRAFT_13647, partial [Nadsonia fulvescens var. elongata DSM 6958]